MRFFMKRIGKIFTLFLALMLCFIGCKNNEDDSSSKKIIATFEGGYESEEEEEWTYVFINFYDDKSWDAITLLDGKKEIFYEGTYEGNPEKDGFINLIIKKIMGENPSENGEFYIRIKNGKFTWFDTDFIRQ